jgi:four helix bundle protein
MIKTQNSKPVYDLEERTFLFAKDIRLWIKTLHQTLANLEDAKQLVRSSGSVGANYIEANESLSKKDFLMHNKISRKEAKETHYWLRLIYDSNNLKDDSEVERLIQEATELKKILSSIIEKSR